MSILIIGALTLIYLAVPSDGPIVSSTSKMGYAC